ncbi:hypothetical protein H0H81_005818 [Sphagnurus paluster]|uniref:U3 small nucleolar RNA-associated protein 10 n=1 Tax=Sphagnurus paluster TaxID=117069 RepID=A0A9P7FTP4_9AGAR|nr:hypothetical protein H0H81_005818 [Sphagnurus paluster]
MTDCAEQVSTKQYINAILSVCEPQDELETFSEGSLKTIINISDIEKELRAASVWVGIEKILNPMLPGLITCLDDNRSLSLLESIIATPKLPQLVIRRGALLLVHSVLTDGTSPAARQLLAAIQQRHPTAFEDVMTAISADDSIDQDIIDQLRISLSVVQRLDITRADNVDMILASTNADARIRTAAVNDLLERVPDELAADEMKSVNSALVARIQDTNQAVLDALYSRPHILLPILAEDTESYISSLSTVLSAPGSKPKRSLLRTHLNFVATQFCPMHSVHVDAIFQQVIFPFLLFSKPRQHTAELVWEIISSQQPSSAHEWLSGCAGIVASEREKDASDTTDRMGNMDILISAQIARNIMKSNHYVAYFQTLLSKLKDPNPHTKVLGYLITRALLVQLSGEQQFEAAHKVLDVIGVEALEGMEDLPLVPCQGGDEITLAKLVVAKPSSRSTIQRLQVAIIALLPSIERPAGIALNWLGDASQASLSQRGSSYVQLCRKIYRLANASGSTPVFTTHILETLFTSLQGDSLAFLAGIWMAPIQAKAESLLRTVALSHAAAFLQAHVSEDDGVDFQTILPALLVALQISEADARHAALACISHLCQLADRKLTSVYSFDTIYGKGEYQLQYLDRDDLKKYIDALQEHRDHLAHDFNYLTLFHQQHLGRIKGDKKRDSEYKHRILCFIMSHINAIDIAMVQISLLKSVEVISDSTKVQILLPTIKSLVQSINGEKTPVAQELIDLLVSSFDTSAAKDLDLEQGEMWTVFKSVVRASFVPGAPPNVQKTISKSLQEGLFTALNTERKVTLCHLLLDLGVQNAETYTACKQLLATLVEDVQLIVHILDSLQPATNINAPRASKRPKTSYTSDDQIPRLSLFVEVLGARSLPGSLDLVSHLLETLNRVLQSIPCAQAEVSYIEQLLMSAIENAASKIVEIPNLTPNGIRLDILVELIRVADNPQTFHQALLLMANLARLAPDSVLRNVMPIFTFMGSNVFHRDDAYSFKVVQQTVDSIVPVMVSSLKNAHTETLDLYIASKEFIRVFTDAANHIPRHRRTNFFAHLINVLGYEDFLPPVCMLLVEKMANRVVRQSADDVQVSLALPTSILHHTSSSLQIRTLTSILKESQRLANRVTNPESTQPTFLEASTDEEPTAAATTITRRRALALITFVGNALKPPSSGSTASEEELRELVAALISLSSLGSGTTSDRKVDDICQAARATLNKALSVMAASDFINGVLSMIESEDSLVQTGALDLLSERLPQVSERTRLALVPAIAKIIGVIGELLCSHTVEAISVASFKALRSIGLSLCPGEESALAETIPFILKSIRGRNATVPAICALSPLPGKIGPRIIPYFREIVSESVALIREGSATNLEDIYPVLNGLLSNIPNFWGAAEITQLITLCIDYCESTLNTPSPAMTSLMKVMAKRAPAGVLLPSMIDLWNSSKILRMPPYIAYFDLLARGLRSAGRPAVLEHLRPLFKVFLEAFDFAKDLGADVEIKAVIAFQELVVKLNEAAFRPLFRRLYDWAFVGSTDNSSRKITFCHIYAVLLDFFKGLMTPYMSFLLTPFVETLESAETSHTANESLWTRVIETLAKSLTHDDGAFWREDKLRQIATPLVKQIPVCVRSNASNGKSSLQDCLVALTDTVTDDLLLKSINLDILMHTRSEDVRLRLFALTCSEKLWKAHGGKLLGFVAETSTFIVECTEDENDMVVRESFKLKDAVESVAGNIDGL